MSHPTGLELHGLKQGLGVKVLLFGSCSPAALDCACFSDGLVTASFSHKLLTVDKLTSSLRCVHAPAYLLC